MSCLGCVHEFFTNLELSSAGAQDFIDLDGDNIVQAGMADVSMITCNDTTQTTAIDCIHAKNTGSTNNYSILLGPHIHGEGLTNTIYFDSHTSGGVSDTDCQGVCSNVVVINNGYNVGNQSNTVTFRNVCSQTSSVNLLENLTSGHTLPNTQGGCISQGSSGGVGDFYDGVFVPPQRTVSTLPTPDVATGAFSIVTDGVGASDCTVGGGTTKVACWYNGTYWQALAIPTTTTLASSSTNTNLSTLTVLASTPAVQTSQVLHVYVGVSVAGVACTGSTTLNFNTQFNDPNGAALTSIQTPLTITATESATVGSAIASFDVPFYAKASTAVKVSTSGYTAGSGCTTNPSYQAFLTLNQQSP
jgi:hypothetical protein